MPVILERVAERLQRAVRSRQREHRVPAVQVALCRGDRPPWTFQVGTAGPGTVLDERTQFRIGSVTKTFTAVMLMQCRDRGLLDLDDRVGEHLTLPRHGELTLRGLLSHTSGLQREPYGDIWDSLLSPGAEQVLAELDRAERVLPPARRLHYSNLGFALLGQVVAAKRGGRWEEVLADDVLRPLGLTGVTVQPTERAATGYLVDAYSDHVQPEPVTELHGMRPVGGLWGTATDLARWAAFLADPATVDPDGAVLAADTVAEMRAPRAMWDDSEWRVGVGLGLFLRPLQERVVDVGHDGAMPGFLAEAYGRHGDEVPRGTGVAVLLSSGTAVGAMQLGHELMDVSLEEDPPDIEPWTPGEPAPDRYRSLLGRWWSEGFEHVFAWRRGRLEARPAGAAAGAPPAVFAVEGPDLLRTISGREAGERLRLTRDADGRVVLMHWATYRFTRDQQTFEGFAASDPAPARGTLP